VEQQRLAAHNLARGQQRWHLRILQETPTQAGYTFEPSGNGRVFNNSFVFSAASLATAVNVGGNTAPSTFMFSNNNWWASDNASLSAPTLPTTETDGVSGTGTDYAGVDDDPHVNSGGAICGGPELGGGIRIPDVDGTITGICRSAPQTTIGPAAPESCNI